MFRVGNEMAGSAIYFSILILAVCAGAASQILIKSRLSFHGQMPAAPMQTVEYVARLLLDPLVLVALVMLVGAALSWYFVVSRIPLNIAFAFAALSYPLVLFGAHLFLKEPIGFMQIVGNLLIVSGIVLVAYSGRGL